MSVATAAALVVQPGTTLSAPVASAERVEGTPAVSDSVLQATDVVKDALEQLGYRKATYHTVATGYRLIDYVDPKSGATNYIDLPIVLPNSISTSYIAPVDGVHTEGWQVSYLDYVHMHQLGWWTGSWSQSDASRIAQSLRILVVDARQYLSDNFAATFDKFKQDCQSSHGGKPASAMPDDARSHKVLAENAFQEKDLEKTRNEYKSALDLYPCWTAGQYNMAMVSGETGYYPLAILHMKEYIALVPDAPDASSAKDKIIIWQDKMGGSDAGISVAPPAPSPAEK